MKKENIALFTLIIVMLAAVGLATSQQLTPDSAGAAAASPQAAGPNREPAADNVPVHVAYGLYFGEMLALKKKADEMERNGKPAAGLRDFDKQRANLGRDQSEVLDRIAADCNEKVIRFNDEARSIIDRERARHPHGKLKDGEQLPLPPRSLKVLEEKRKAALLDAREQLRTAFGEEEFKRFDDFVQQDITARTKGVPARRG